jgi:basic membrane protein A
MTFKHRNVLALLAATALVASACSSSAATASPVVTPSPVVTEAASATAAPSAPSATATPLALKIGVVTDVGRVDDKNFNQYSYEGAKAAATALGTTAEYVVPKDASDYTKDIQSFIDQKYNVIVTVGFNLGDATIKAAKANPNVWFIAVDVAPCVDATGAPDSTFKCAGDASKLLPHLIGVTFQEDQAGYLAGIVAASVSKTGNIGQLGGINNNPAVVRYLQGYQLGAASYKASTKVQTDFFSTGDLGKAYGDPVFGKTFSTQFIKQKGVDVLFQVAGGTGNGALDAACAANILAIGVDVDEYLSYPTADKCIVTSAEKHLSSAVNQTITAISKGTAAGGVSKFNAANDGIGISPFHNTAITIPADVQGKLDTALAAMKAGTLKTCPDTCGTWK